MVTAHLRSYRQSPRKVRLVAGLLSGKSVPNALQELAFLDKRAALPVRKLIESAVANAKNALGLLPENLFIKELRVDKAPVLKRSMPRARGSAFPIHKHSSHVSVTLIEYTPVIKEKKATISKTLTS
jgi:large subunit ribosomal protein L22